MSGPKVSIYRVEPYIRQNILMQQRLKRRCISLFRRIHDRLSDLETIKEECERFMNLQKGFGMNQEAVAACQEMMRTIREGKESVSVSLHKLGPIEKMPVKYRYSPETVERDTIKVQNLEEVHRECRKTYAGIQKQVLDMMNRYKVDYARVSEESKEAVSQIGRFDFNEIAVKKVRHDWSRRDAAAEKLRELMADHELSAGLRERAGEAVARLLGSEDEHTAGNYILVVVSGIIKDAERERSKQAEEFAEYGDRIKAYHAMCEELGREPVGIPFSGQWRELLGEAISKLETSQDQSNEKDYIRDCLDTVMTEMGYKVIGCRDVKKKSGKSFHSSLYSYADGRAINVTQSDDGQITMELGGLDHCDRLPDNREAEALEEDMYSFCDSFAEIENRLRRKGVLMTDRISRQAPAQEFATIINLDDFVMTSDQAVETIAVADVVQNTNAKEMHHE